MESLFDKHFRDLGIAQATYGKVIAHLVKTNMAPESGTGWHRLAPS